MSGHSESKSSEVIPARQPLMPSLTNLQDQVKRMNQSTIPAGLEKLQDSMDKLADDQKSRVEPMPFLDSKFAGVVSQFLRERMLGGAWPPELFIPADADWKQYWLRPPDPGANRYSFEYISGDHAKTAQIASFHSGQIFAQAAAQPTDAFLQSEAWVGFVYFPTATLATYEIEASVDTLFGQNRYDVSTTASAGGSLRQWGGIYTIAYEISDYDGSLSIVHPIGVATLFDETFQNLTGVGVHTWPRFSPLKTNIMLQGGRFYLIAVIASVQIVNGWTMNDGRPMQSLPDGSLWKAWGYVIGNIPQVWISPSIVYIP